MLSFDDGSHSSFHSYTKTNFLRNVYMQKADTFQKARQFPLRFIYKAIHLTLRDFHEIFEVGIYIQKA